VRSRDVNTSSAIPTA